MESPQFNLRWNNHSFNIVQVFLEQLSSESLVDVTLSCQGQFLKAHKMVLSACSSYFQDLFNFHEAQHPVIILDGIKFNDLKIIVDFMYRGETRVLESELNGILAVAEALRVKGLCHVREKDVMDDNESVSLINPVVSIDEESSLDFLAPEDPLHFLSTEPPKPVKKRKRIEGKSSKVVQAKVFANEVQKSEISPPKPSTSKGFTLRDSSPKSSVSTASRAPSPPETLTQVTSSRSPSPLTAPMAVSPRSKSPSKHPTKVYSSKARTSKSSTATTYSSNEEDQSMDEVLPFVQVSLNDLPNDDDDLASTIKVEPLFIRDIDDNDTSWDDPSKQAVESPEGKNDESSSSKEVQNKNGSPDVSLSKKKIPFVLKVRPASELIASQETESLADPLSLDITDASQNVKLPNQRRTGEKKIPRPPNAFMIFANDWRKKLALENPAESNKQISVRLGLMWKEMSTEDKAVYFTASRRADEEHKRKYPNYFYSPKEARLRKAANIALRDRRAIQNKFLALCQVKKPNVDPLRISKASQKTYPKKQKKDNTFVYTASIRDGSLTLKAEIMDDEPNPQNLAEDLLEIVKSGEMEAEVGEAGRSLDGEVSSQETSTDTQIQKQ